MSERDPLAGEYAVLCLLALRPMHGYEMLTFITDEGLDEVCPVEQSTLYTYLRNLEARALVSWTEERVGLRPPRKTFALTASGRDLIDRWLRAPVTRMRETRLELLVKLFFLDRLDPPARRLLLDGQVAACQRYLGVLDARPQATDFQRLVVASKRSAAEATLHWLKSYTPAGGPR